MQSREKNFPKQCEKQNNAKVYTEGKIGKTIRKRLLVDQIILNETEA